MGSISIEQIRIDLKDLNKYDVIVFGSYVEGGMGPKSDIDIAVITKIHDRDKNQQISMELMGKYPPLYEIHVYELLPLTVKHSFWDNFETIFGNKLDISEYFYQDRKIWRDCKHRILENQFDSVEQQIQLIRKNRK